jgi:dienelactone hydrolase
MKHILYCFLTALLTYQQAVAQPPKLPEYVKHLPVQRLNDSYIDAYVYQRPSNKKQPVLIICQGSGVDSNTEGLLGLLSQYGDKAAGLVIEKQGVKYGDNGDSISSEYVQHNTIYNRLYDYLRVLQYLRTHANWWNGDIYIVGGSEGGLLAGLLASFYPHAKGLAILCYGGGIKFGESWPLSSGLIKKAEGASPQKIKEEEKAVQDSIKYMSLNPSFLKTFSGKDNSHAWWASIADLRLSNALIDLNIPIYIGHGSEDIMALPASARQLQERFKKANKSNLHFKEYEGLDHAFNDKKNKSHLVSVFMEAISYILQP